MIQKLNSGHLEKCVGIAFLRNNLPESNSAYCPKSRDSIQGEFDFLLGSVDHLAVGHFENGTINGICGFFFNPENNWADCVGMFFAEKWDESTALEMFAFAKEKLAVAVRFNFYFDARNKNLHDLMEKLGAVREDNEYVLLLEKADYVPRKLAHNIVPYHDGFENEIAHILAKTFPNSYVSAKELIKSVGKGREIFCALDEKGVFVGYGVLSLHESHPNQATAEIFAVYEEHRGKGYGWALLNAVVDCAISNHGAQKVNLVVDRLNKHAAELYYSCGFKLSVENSSYFVKS